MNTAIVDDDVAINLDGRAIVTRRVERVLAIAIGAKPTAPFDAELLLRERRRIRCHEVEINLSLHEHTSRLVAPVRVGVKRRCNAPLRPHPQDWHEEDRYEKDTCHPPHVRAPVTGYCGCDCRGSGRSGARPSSSSGPRPPSRGTVGRSDTIGHGRACAVSVDLPSLLMSAR